MSDMKIGTTRALLNGKKGKPMHFSKTIVVCDMKVGTTQTAMNAKGQGYLVTLAQGH